MSEDGAADDSAVLRRQRGQTCPRCGRAILSGDASVVQAYCLECRDKLRARIESVLEALERSSSEALKSCELGEAPPPASIEKLKSGASLLEEKMDEARGAGVDGALLERARACWFRALEASVSARRATLQAEEEEKGDDEGERQEKLAAEQAKEADRRLSEEQARFRESMADAARREDTPPWVTGEKFVSSLWGPVRIMDTALRGVSLKQVLSLADYVRQCLQSHDVIDTDKNSPTKGQRIRWESLNMYQVCTQFVMPLTREHRCSYVELIGEGDSAEGVPPLWMASHWWGTTFAHTVNMLKCHAQARYGGTDTHSPEETTYWICTLAKNQHDIDNELNEDDMMHTPFARAMLKASCQGTVLLCDPDVRVLERAWCILEIYITEQLRRMPSWAPDEIQATDGVHFLDVVSPVTARDLPEGLEEPVGGCSAMFVDVGEAGWHEHTTLPGIHFPLRVAQKGVLVNMVRSEASRPEDWRRIMNFIAFKKVSDGKPPAQNQEYVNLNLFIHEVFFSAELFRLCLELPEDAVSRAKELIVKGANPNNIVRCGHTPLFAAVGAGQFQEHDEGKKETQKELVEFPLDSRADPNVANSSMNTALDYARDGDIERLLKGRSCKTFGEMAPQLEKAINKQLKGTIKLGCGRLNVFSGSGGGGVADKLSAEGLKSLQSAAALMHRYPGAPCTIRVRQQRRASMTTAELEAMARARKVEAVLQGAGCRNPFRLETAHAQVTPLPPAVAIKMNLQKMDEIKNFGGALLLNELAAESDSEPAQESESESELSTGSDWDRVTRIFKKCDSDGSGTISREELERVLLSLKPDLTQEQMIVMFNCADADHNGEIDLGEFLAWINSSDPTVSELKENSKVSSPQSTQALGDSPGRRSLQGSSRRSTRSRETPRRVESALDA